MEVHVGPLQPQQLRPAHAGGQRDVPQWVQLVAVGLPQERLHLFRGPRRHLPSPRRSDGCEARRVGVDRRVRDEHPPRHGVVECLADDAVDAVDRRGGQSTCAVDPAVGQQVRVQPVQIGRLEIGEHDVAETRDHVVLELLLAVVPGLPTHVGRLRGRQPVPPEIDLQCHVRRSRILESGENLVELLLGFVARTSVCSSGSPAREVRCGNAAAISPTTLRCGVIIAEKPCIRSDANQS